jgi:hypothetical protein
MLQAMIIEEWERADNSISCIPIRFKIIHFGKPDSRSKKFGTFSGVFYPLAPDHSRVIRLLKMRCVGNSGFWELVEHHRILLINALSMSAILTNSRMGPVALMPLSLRPLALKYEDAMLPRMVTVCNST